VSITKEQEDLTGVVAAGRRVREFMDDPTIREVLQDATDTAYAQFQAAETDAELRAAQALRKALDLIASNIAVRVSRGEAARVELERIEKSANEAAARAAARATRK
jgi:CHASE3 domain sensor protein